MMENYDWSQFDKGNITKLKIQPDKGKFYKMEVSMSDRDTGIKDKDGLLYSKDGKRLLRAPDDLKYYTIPEGVEVICNSAFYRCKQLKNIKLPKIKALFLEFLVLYLGKFLNQPQFLPKTSYSKILSLKLI